MPLLLFLAVGAAVALVAVSRQQVNELHRTTILKAGRVYNLRLLNLDPSMGVTPDMVTALLEEAFAPNAAEVQFIGQPWTEANYVWSATVALPGANDLSFTLDSPYTVEDIGSALLSAN